MAKITAFETRRMIQSGKNSPYNSFAKAEFEHRSMRLLKQVRTLLGLTPKTCRVHYNAGGMAVSGESTLHSDRVYIQVSGFTDLGILVRAVTGRSDYSGKANHYFSFDRLIDFGAHGLAQFAEQIASQHTGLNWSKSPACDTCGISR